jgi:acetyl-CoA carboxylase carboxyl transferase alpha subunit/acetyl-CoA carboxylase carboxyl transferase beta subunit
VTLKNVEPKNTTRVRTRVTRSVRAWWARAFKRRALQCPTCALDLAHSALYKSAGVCERCGHHFPISARRRIELLSDPRSFEEFNKSLSAKPPDSLSAEATYRKRLREAQRETHMQEAVITGYADIEERRVVLIVMDFRFMGGSMGWAAGEKIALAFERAAAEALPVVAVTSTGGARIQEGMFALMQLANTAAAAQRLRARGLPYITVLAHPTTGGVYASFANLADIILAEPRALVGFAGPRVVEALTRQKLPADSHRAEFQFAHGMVDALVPRPQAPHFVAQVLRQLLPAAAEEPSGEHAAAAEAPIPLGAAERPAWEIVRLARMAERPTALDYIKRLFDNFVELHGDRLFGDDPAIIAGLGSIEKRAVVIIGQERGHGDEVARRHEGRAEPEGYRKALRAMRLAAKFHLPIITFVDTPGADSSYDAEKRGAAMALAQSIGAMTEIATPTVALVIGEGGSGGAIALAVADRVLMQENAIYSVISPEGASAILFGDTVHAEEVSHMLRLTARELKRLGIIDEIIAEPHDGAHTDIEESTRILRQRLVSALAELRGRDMTALLEERYQKYRRIGRTAR